MADERVYVIGHKGCRLGPCDRKVAERIAEVREGIWPIIPVEQATSS